MADSKNKLSWAVYCGAVSYLALSAHSTSVYAQTALPAVTVDAPKKRETVQRPQASRSAARPRQAARRVAAPLQQQPPVPHLTPSTGALGAPPAPAAGGQVATGGQVGFLGNRSVMD